MEALGGNLTLPFLPRGGGVWEYVYMYSSVQEYDRSGLLLGLTAASALTGGELHGCGRARRSLRKLTLPLPSTTHAHTSTQQNACTHSLGNMASCAELGKCNMAVNGED